jgi:hypothetical protein
LEGQDRLSLAQDMSQMCEGGNEISVTINYAEFSVRKQLLDSQEEPCSMKIVTFSGPFS